MKEDFIKPVIDITLFDTEDIIMVSPNPDQESGETPEGVLG